MSDKFRPLVIEDVNGNRAFVNCCEIVSIVTAEYLLQKKDTYVIELSTGIQLFVSFVVAEILMDRLTDELFFSPESIEREKAILNQPTQE